MSRMRDASNFRGTADFRRINEKGRWMLHSDQLTCGRNEWEVFASEPWAISGTILGAARY